MAIQGGEAVGLRLAPAAASGRDRSPSLTRAASGARIPKPQATAGPFILVGDTFHNLVDGAAIAASDELKGA